MPRPPAMPRSYWLDANVFAAMFSLAGTMGVSILFIPAMWVAGRVVPYRHAETVALAAAYLLLLVALAWAFRALGMSSTRRDPLKRQQVRLGHGMLLFANGVTLMMFFPAVMGRVALALAHVMSPEAAVLSVPTVGALVAFAGLLVLHSARMPPPVLTAARGFADTQPQDA